MEKKRSNDELIAFLEANWQGKRTKEVREAFLRLRKALASAKIEHVSEKAPMHISKGEPFSVLDLMRRVCSGLDLQFLGRQVTYHIAASSELPQVSADAMQMQTVLSELFRHMAKRAPYGGRINVSLKEVSTRSGKGIEISLCSIDEKSEGLSRAHYLEEIFGAGAAIRTSPLLSCREVITKQGGQMTIDMPEPKRTVFKITLPVVGTPAVSKGDYQTFRYDIAIKNISNVRKRFGIKKSHMLVAQIENYVRSLVRHPIDIVMASHDKGIITAIYETNKGSAQSVASRISERLGSEEFRIGKKPVEVNFHYQLTILPSSGAEYD